MEPPPIHVAAVATALPTPYLHHHPPYPDSLDSSPRSIDDHPHTTFPAIPPPSSSSAASKLRLMCSYAGHIVPRPQDKSLCYVGGETRIVVVDRHSTLPDLLSRLSKLLLSGKPFTLKYQLPSEDLDSLITVSNDEDLENMLDEYDRLTAAAAAAASKPSRLRLFLFPAKPETAPSSISSVLDGSSAKSSEGWFFDALNATGTGIRLPRGFSDPASVNSLLGLEENIENSGNSDPNLKEEGNGKSVKLGICNNNSNQDVHSMPDSPMIETTSSFGSTSSSLANLAPARVHVEDGGAGRGGGDEVRVLDQRIGGIEEQFSQLGVGAGLHVKQDEGYVLMPSQVVNKGTTTMVTGIPLAAGAAGAEYLNRVVSDDERSDHGVPVGYSKPSAAEYPNLAVSDDERSDPGAPVGYRKPPAAEYLNRVVSDDERSDHEVPVGHRKPSAPQNQPVIVSSQSQQMLIGSEFPSSDSVPRRQKTITHQDSGGQVPPLGSMAAPNLVDAKVVNVPEPSTMAQMQQKSDSGYALPSQYDLQQQQQLLQQQHQQRLQQFIANPHYVHHSPAGPVSIPAYYPVYASQHPQLPHHQGQYPVYYIPAGHPQTYGLPVQQPSFTDAPNAVHTGRAQAPSNPAIISTPEVCNPTGNFTSQKPEVAAGVYRVAAGAPSTIVQVPSGQHLPQKQQQYVQIPQHQYVQMPQHLPHPSQSIAPAGSYAYEFADPAQTRLYYPQSMPLPLVPQRQTISTAPAVVSLDSSALLPADNVMQQARGAQPQV